MTILPTRKINVWSLIYFCLVLHRTGEVCGALLQALTIYKAGNYPKVKRGINNPQNLTISFNRSMIVMPACVSSGDIQGSLSVVWRRRHHKIISVTFFSETTEASFLIFGTEHQYGELYRVRQFRICHMSTSCLPELRIFLTQKNLSKNNFCHIFLRNHRSQLPDIWHRASVWRTVSCNTVSNLPHVYFCLPELRLFILKNLSK